MYTKMSVEDYLLSYESEMFLSYHRFNFFSSHFDLIL